MKKRGEKTSHIQGPSEINTRPGVYFRRAALGLNPRNTGLNRRGEGRPSALFVFFLCFPATFTRQRVTQQISLSTKKRNTGVESEDKKREQPTTWDAVCLTNAHGGKNHI